MKWTVYKYKDYMYSFSLQFIYSDLQMEVIVKGQSVDQVASSKTCHMSEHIYFNLVSSGEFPVSCQVYRYDF